MPLTVKIDNPAYPPGTEFEIVGLGVFKNGEATEVSDEQEQMYMSATYMTVQEGLSGATIEVSGESSYGSVEEVLGVSPEEILEAGEEAPQEEEQPVVEEQPQATEQPQEPQAGEQ